MSLVVSTFRRTRLYFWAGLAALCLLAYVMRVGHPIQAATPERIKFGLSVVTGTALAGCILYQWALFFARLAGHAPSARYHYRNHRYVGTAAVYLFILHAGGFGYALLALLPVLFLVVSVSGLFNSEVISMPWPWMRRCWGYLHVALSGLLLPLIALHAWAALAFK